MRFDADRAMLRSSVGANRNILPANSEMNPIASIVFLLIQIFGRFLSNPSAIQLSMSLLEQFSATKIKRSPEVVLFVS